MKALGSLLRRSPRPRIGVTGPDEGGAAAWWFTRFAVWRAGGRARRITPARPAPIEELDGLVVGGGADVAPSLYGRAAPSLGEALREDEGREEEIADREAEHDRKLRSEERSETPARRARLRTLWKLLTWPFRLVSALTLGLRKLAARKSAAGSPEDAAGDVARDRLETELLRGALAGGKPVLGICRGAQLLNVHLGGTLHQDLAEFYEETPQIRTVRPRKRIEVAPESLLAEILRTRDCRVNALHRQAVDELAEGLRAVAREPTGVVQAVEHRERPYLLGVQWHPEYLPQIRRQQRIFRRLVETASRVRET